MHIHIHQPSRLEARGPLSVHRSPGVPHAGFFPPRSVANVWVLGCLSSADFGPSPSSFLFLSLPFEDFHSLTHSLSLSIFVVLILSHSLSFSLSLS